MYKALVIVVAFISLSLGILIGKFTEGTNQKVNVLQKYNLNEVRAGGYKFISPLLECETNSDYYKLNGLDSLQNEVETFVQEEKDKGVVTDAAVYFRDLKNGPWFGVNEHAAFAPASLLKLPVMMAYYKKAESDPQLLKKKVDYEAKDPLLDQNIAPTESLQKGKSYTIEDLIERMMIYSDNAALTMLEDNIDPAFIDKVTQDLGVETANVSSPLDFMSVKGYAGLFRILFNASYLEKDYSEKALEILSRSDFTKGLLAGVPRGVTVSHKFGERALSENSVQLHDCGIVYYPSSPYLLCVMTRGTNMQNLEQFISNVSSITYKGIQEKRKKVNQ